MTANVQKTNHNTHMNAFYWGQDITTCKLSAHRMPFTKRPVDKSLLYKKTVQICQLLLKCCQGLAEIGCGCDMSHRDLVIELSVRVSLCQRSQYVTRSGERVVKCQFGHFE